MKTEKNFKGQSGFLYLILVLAMIAGAIVGLILTKNKLFLTPLPIALLLSIGFKVVQPNHSMVLTLFGAYKGTLKDNGFWWVNPFFSKKSVSLRARNMDREPVKVNDKLGNPIMIGAVLVWRVKDTFKAVFEVDAYEQFVKVQSESAVRQLATHYAYDKFDDAEAETSLRDGGEEVNGMLEETLRNRLDIAGIEVIEARISYLAYASEIAGAMLQRQQATAVVAARQKIVEGAVGMVEMALDSLKAKAVVDFDNDRKAAMVSNLMVVLCSDKAATPVVSTGL
jgi:regulator of protease activity HflC (stomatin/prohibitin superfamily)